jgi:hypothetical protein
VTWVVTDPGEDADDLAGGHRHVGGSWLAVSG